MSAGTATVTAYLAIGPMFLAYLLFGAGLRTVRGSTATTITLVEPLAATILAILVVGERLDPVGWTRPRARHGRCERPRHEWPDKPGGQRQKTATLDTIRACSSASRAGQEGPEPPETPGDEDLAGALR